MKRQSLYLRTCCVDMAYIGIPFRVVYLHNAQMDLAIHFKQVICAYIFSAHTSIGFSLYEVIYGTKPVKVMDRLVEEASAKNPK
ncbi:hypothetical protein BpHYR1_053794 [Brachionus plicatilis]|uniref:Uncharacterized protein n=1 Tax=Brachionus plicatilis TaxID=10195 RepID=A0A3M7TBN6_BRAPC|nr:hypothetical protein BpHYR1_053794 [Brachionus plicatilis]